MAVATHPNSDTLAAFARGDLPPAELAAVSEHVGVCEACCAAIARVPDDTFAGLARAAAKAGATPAAPPYYPAEPDAAPAALADHPRYKILRELGQGGMGVVYKAEHRIMGRVVALKVVAPHLTAKAGAVDRFRKEVRAAASLNHPNIVTAHDADEAGGMHFLVMEFVEGTSLDRLVAKKGPLPPTMACSFARQAALGLQHAHEKGMVHRDIKPQNLMVTRKAQVKVMDFGLARFASNDAADTPPPGGRLPFGAGRPVADLATNPNLLMGTPDYLSPEQAKNSHAVDARSDVYSLGCTLFFLLTGKPPFAHAESLIDKLLAHTEEPPAPVRDLRPEVPEGLAAVVEKLLAKNPDDRYPTAAEAAAALHPFTRSGENADRAAGFEVIDAVVIAPPAAATPAPAAAEFDTAPVPDEATVAEERPRKKKSRKSGKARPWWKKTWAKVTAGALLLGIVAVAAARKKPEDKSADPPQAAGNKSPQPGANPDRPVVKKEILPVLYVVPSDGVHARDYFPVVEALKKHKVDVTTASGKGGTATVASWQNDGMKTTVAVEVALAGVNIDKYSAVAFCGADVLEYLPPVGKGSLWNRGRDAERVLEDAKRKNKPIAGICRGEMVLMGHGVLSGKPAARSPEVDKRPPGLFAERYAEVLWRDERVVTADYGTGGKVVTAATDNDAEEFARALAKAVGAE